jgi:hypothetical protein
LWAQRELQHQKVGILGNGEDGLVFSTLLVSFGCMPALQVRKVERVVLWPETGPPRTLRSEGDGMLYPHSSLLRLFQRPRIIGKGRMLEESTQRVSNLQWFSLGFFDFMIICE